MQSIINKKSENSYIHFLNRKTTTIQNSLLRASFEGMPNEPHRLERYLSVRGVAYVDDVKAQSVNALWYSLEQVSTEITLVIRAVENSEKLLLMQSLMNLKVRNLVVLGKSDKKLRTLAKNLYCVNTIEQAVLLSHAISEPGEAVLYSPATAVDISKESAAYREAIRNL